MFSVLFIVIMSSAFVAAMAAGAVISFLLAVALSVTAALGAGFLRWPEELIWTAQLAAPVLLIIGLSVSRWLDRLSRRGAFNQRAYDERKF
ncbi:hypothetical protein J2T09_005394 [Neorhizobium huautlense]|uniref:Uncharacterized protein n=1 Tax=Neorhizobium huautlense TaxID=67774 RepID=A0ABT9Q2L4_9HYPH|nr:hypothetical protein [Neorhizobium huautlense]MDP9840606.1 hypothetical protein [Neorhizobium huautlense]